LFAQNLRQALQVVWSVTLRDFVDPKPDKQNETAPATPLQSGKRVVATEDLGACRTAVAARANRGHASEIKPSRMLSRERKSPWHCLA